MTTTSTKEEPKAEEKKVEKVKITIGGREIEVDADNKLVAQLKNVVETQREDEFKEAREKIAIECTKAIDEKTKGFDDQLEGMALVFNFDDGKPQMVQFNRIKVMDRGPRKPKE